jgi:tetratricopeptide (TPR) repeat protein
MQMLNRLLAPAIAVFFCPLAVFAAGSDNTAPPTPTATTTKCEEGLVFDDKAKKCVAPVEGSLDDDTLYGAVRELAYAGKYDAALTVLAAMSDQTDDRVLTYLGFINRKMGNVERGMTYYDVALALNPDNLLARSYLGQGLVEQGEIELAEAQLDQIVARGGAGSWAEQSLRTAIATGVTYTY